MVFKKNSDEKIRQMLLAKGATWLSGVYDKGYKSVLVVRYDTGHVVEKTFRRIMDGKGCICKDCSVLRRNISNTGKIRTEEQKLRYRESKLGDKNPRKGIPTVHSKTTRKKLSESKKGEKNPSWRSDLTPEEKLANRTRIETSEHKRWAFRIKKRDKFECQICFKDRDLQSHHIESYVQTPEKRFHLRNGICLCKQCHKEFHSTFGNKNINRQQLNQFKKGKQLSLLLILSCFLK